MKRALPLLFLAFGVGFASSGEELGEAALELGAAIYQRGDAATLEEVLIGDPPASAPLALFPCRGCHGDDGRGAEESGVVAPEIRWSYLSKPYAVRSGPFRVRPAYDEKLLARALRDGVDSTGRRFGTAMPRYPLDDREIAGLIAYLRELDQVEKASPFGQDIPIGVRLPGEGIGQRQGEVMRAVLENYFDWINQRGGIFERKIRLHFQAATEPFAVGLAAGLDLAIAQPGAERLEPPADAVPVLALFPAPTDSESERFTLYSGPEDRAAALKLFARRTLGFDAAAIAILDRDAVPPLAASRAVLYTGHDAAALRKALSALPADVVLLLTGWLESPQLMDLAKQHAGLVYVATPPTPHFLNKAGRDLLARLELAADQRMVQLWALAAARALEAALEKAGRDLRPQGLGEVLESFTRLETGVGPDLRFSPSRHLGARGAVVLRLSPGQESIAEWHWIELDDRGGPFAVE